MKVETFRARLLVGATSPRDSGATPGAVDLLDADVLRRGGQA
jgi:hypothetical protein